MARLRNAEYVPPRAVKVSSRVYSCLTTLNEWAYRMRESRHLPNAPITEAIIDFRVKLASDFKSEGLNPVVGRLKGRFPKADQLKAMQAVFEMKDGTFQPPETKPLGPNGYILRSEDGRDIVQFRLDGFTYNRLKPYTRWEEVFPTAFELWNLYIEIASPEIVTRLATRYINHIRLPGLGIDFDDYLTAGPKIPPELPQEISTFLIRLVLHDRERGLAANVTQALEPPVDPHFTTVILDIDAYKVSDWPPKDPGIVETIDRLRVFKNRVFFSHITEATVRLFE